MLKNQDIICISSIDWDFIWQGHQEIMSAFARAGNRVLFIENTGVRKPSLKDIPRLKKRLLSWIKSIKGFRDAGENLFVYSPVILPFPYSRIARRINRYLLLGPLKKWMKIMGFAEPIIWTFLPTGTALDIIDSIDSKLVVYYCIADFYELADNPRKVKLTEDRLIRISELVFVQGHVLEDRCRKLNKNVYIFPFGVNIEDFENFQKNPLNVPADIKDIKRPIIGYIGGIHRHIDFGLLKFIASSHPEWSVVLIGPAQVDTRQIDNLANVYLLGKKDFPELPGYINEFDVAIIPYEKSEYTATVFPTKLNEYHAMGRPVVSTDLPEVVNFNAKNNNLVRVARSYEEFNDFILQALNNNKSAEIGQRIASARGNSWSKRIQQMSDLLQQAIDKKLKVSADWRERLLKIYRMSRKRAAGIIFVSLCLYLLLVYSPLVWFGAQPLKISQPPQAADAILVFAGGVGESGKAGQGYEERVKYAVELFKSGYARNLIFSSGYTFVFKEPLIMKALAVSLGVPEDAIYLEEEAGNTYENVKFSNKLLVKKDWKKVLVVSSPYHMRRVSLVFKKEAPQIQAIYTPIPQSEFYGSLWGHVKMPQIRAILHEYTGIVYYYLRGYI